jgi:Holliday junction DNA helicase RuvA
MIAQLRGRLIEAEAEEAVVDVAGVGYLVRCGARTLSRLGPPGEEVVLYVDSQFTPEGGPRLFGFTSREERRIFRILQSIQGVGPKAALAVLDVLAPGDLARAVAEEDRAAVARAVGVGPKLALRIVTELKGKALGAPPAQTAPGTRAGAPSSAAGEATLALMSLGVAEPQARRAVEQVEDAHRGDLGALVKAALQELGR